jgi:hypothetical protein
VDILKALVAIGAGGGLMSLITSALVGSNWPSAAKQMTAFLICIIGAFIPIVVAGVDLTNMAIVLPLMWVGSQVFYKAWFKPSGLAPWIETLFLNNTSVPVQVQRFAGPNDRPFLHDDFSHSRWDDEIHP